MKLKNLISIGLTVTLLPCSTTLANTLNDGSESNNLIWETDQPGVFIPLPRLVLHGKLLPIWSTGFWNGGLVS